MFGGALGVLDVFGEGVGCANCIFTCNHGDGCGIVRSSIDSFRDDRSNEFEDIRANRASDDVCGDDLFDNIGFVGFRVDGSVVGNDRLAVALCSDLDDFVGLGRLQLVDDAVHNVAEDDLVARVVEAAKVSI